MHDAPLGVMTNAPTYDWHMTNLSNYVNFQSTTSSPRKSATSRSKPSAPEPGCSASPAISPRPRVVRAAIYSQAAVPNETADDAVLAAFHVLNQFDIPKGSVVNAAIGGKMNETEWTSVSDLENLRWYFRTFGDQSIRMVDLKEALAAAKGEIKSTDMESSKQPIGNLSASVQGANHAAN